MFFDLSYYFVGVFKENTFVLIEEGFDPEFYKILCFFTKIPSKSIFLLAPVSYLYKRSLGSFLILLCNCPFSRLGFAGNLFAD